MSPPALATPTWDALARGLAGEVLLPGAAAYEAARAPALQRWAAARPQAVVRCAAPHDVAEALAFARRHGLPTAVRSGGHDFAGRSSTPGLLVDVSPMDEVALRDGLAHVGAGARLGPLYAALAARGVTIPAGCGPTVGIAGLTLGGGVGILGRLHGLTCDRLVAAEVVLADGRVVTCDEHHHADLLWALRGAGAQGLGVVTRLAFLPVAPPAMTAFRLSWSPGAAAAVLRAWQGWAPDAADGVAASLHVTASGAPGAPCAVAVSGALVGGRRDAEEQLGALVDAVGHDPVGDERREGSHHEVKRHLADGDDDGDGEDRVLRSRSEFFRRGLSPEAIAALLARLGAERRPGEGRELDFTPWGGAYNRRAPDATAFAHRAERFLLQHVVAVPADAPAADAAAAAGWLEASFACTRPCGSGRVYPNFPEPGLPDAGRAYFGGNRHRLRRVRAAYGTSQT